MTDPQELLTAEQALALQSSVRVKNIADALGLRERTMNPPVERFVPINRAARRRKRK